LNSDSLLQLLEKAKLFSKNFFAILDIPEQLEDYFFIRFFSKNNSQDQNDRNLMFFRFILGLAYINIIIFFSKKSDLRDKFEQISDESPLNYKTESIFKNIDLDYSMTYPDLDEVLHKLDAKGVHGYNDLITFVKKHMDKFNIPYQTALGLWFVYNLNFSNNQPTKNEIMEIAPLLGSCVIAAAYNTRCGDFLDATI